MRGFLIVFTTFACALARPDIGLKLREQGYQYQQPPATAYGVPNVPSGSYLPTVEANSFHGNAGGGYSSSSSFSSSTANRQSGQNQYDGHLIPNFQTSQSSQSQYQTSYQGSNNYNPDGYSGQVQVQKHVYFYDAPEDLPAPSIRISGQAAAAQKHYKIIFIKAPSYKAPEVPQIPIQQQNEEKTLVYVLVKKPDEGEEIVLPTSTPVKPSKPEVFFINYKTQKEAEQHIHSIQQGQSSGVSANSIDNDAAFVSSIADSKVPHGSSQHTGGLITTGNSDGFNQQVFGNTVPGHQFGASHTSQSVSGTSGHQFGPAGASGPY